MEQLPVAYADGSNIKAREVMGIAAFYAGYAFSKAFLGYVHSISHRLSKHYGTPHGLANALVLPHVLDFSKADIIDRLAELAKFIGLEGKNNDALAQLFIDKVYELSRTVDIPETLDKLVEADIPEIAQAALTEAHFIYAIPSYMTQKDAENVVRKLLPK